MPDIVSRIKVEAQGADAAAREIRKLRDAYAEVSAAAKGMSGAGGADPFSAATTAPGGGIIGGQRSPSEVRSQQSFNTDWRKSADERLNTNTNYSSRYGGSSSVTNPSGFINSAFAGAQQLDNGKTLGALGAGLSSLATIIGPLAGIALGASTLAKTTQALANPAIERRDRIWGSGATQRMKGDYTKTANWEALMKSKGIHKNQVDMFTSAASNSGFTWDGEGADYGAGIALQAQASTGLAIPTSTGFLGALNKAGMSQANLNYSTIGAGVGAFGNKGLGTYISGLTDIVNTRSNSGINMTQAGLIGMQDLITGLGNTGGLSAGASVAAATRLSAKGISAAQLGSSEDLLSMWAMRDPSKSLTENQIAMEENPDKVIEATYGVLKNRYTDKEDLSQAMMGYTKGTMSETVALMKTLDEGGSYKDHRANWDDITEDQELTANLQLQALFKAQEAALNKIVAPLSALASGLLGRDPTLNTGDVAYGDLFGEKKAVVMKDPIIDAEFVVIKPDNVAMDDPTLKGRIGALGSDMGLDLSDTFAAYQEGNLGIQLQGNANTEGIGKANIRGDSPDFAEEMVLGLLSDALAVAPDNKSKKKIRELSQRYSTRVDAANAKMYSGITNESGTMNVLLDILSELRIILPVSTDGDE